MVRLRVSVAVVLVAVLSSLAHGRDGGVPAPAPVAVDGGATPEGPRGGEVERLRREVGELKGRLSDLESRVAKAEAAAADVEKLQKKVEGLRADLDAEQSQRQAREREVAERKAQVLQANATLGVVLQQLSTGERSNVDAWLRGAAQQYTGNAQKLVELARQALAQDDLNTARAYLNLALLEAAAPAP